MNIRRVTIAALAVLVLSPILVAGPGRTGIQVMFSLHTLDFRGDLTRELTLWHFEKSFLIPRLGTGCALSLSLGGKSRGGSWDVAYLRSTHSVETENGTRTASFHAVEINGRSFFLKEWALHPYFLGGISIPIIHVDDGSRFRGADYDATYIGAGLNLGGGFLLEIGPSVVLNAGVIYRWMGFLYAYGEGKGRDINHLQVGFDGPRFGRLLRSGTLSFTIGLGFIL